MEPFIRGHPILCKNSGEMLKVRPGPEFPLELSRSNYEAPMSVRLFAEPAAVVLPLFRDLEQCAFRNIPVLKPKQGFKSEGGEGLVISDASIMEQVIVAYSGIQSSSMTPGASDKTSVYPNIPELEPKKGLKLEGGDSLVPLNAPTAEQVTVANLAPTAHHLQNEAAPSTLEAIVASAAPELIVAPSHLDAEIASLRALELPITLKSPATPQATLERKASISDVYKKFIEEACALSTDEVEIEVAARELDKPSETDSQDTQWSDLSSKPVEEEELVVSTAPVVPMSQPAPLNITSSVKEGTVVTDVPGPSAAPVEILKRQAPVDVDPEVKEDPIVKSLAPSTLTEIGTMGIQTLEPETSVEQRSDYIQFEESLPKQSETSDVQQPSPKAEPVAEAPKTSDAPIEIKNMDLLYDQVSYYKTQGENAPEAPSEQVTFEPLASEPTLTRSSNLEGDAKPMSADHSVPEPLKSDLFEEEGFEKYSPATIHFGYQLSDDERKLIEENQRFFESGQDQDGLASPQEINPMMEWSQRMYQSYHDPSAPVAEEHVKSPEPIAPLHDLEDSLIADFDQFDDGLLKEAYEDEQKVPETM